MNSPVLTFTGLMMKNHDEKPNEKKTSKPTRSPRDEMTVNRIKKKITEQLLNLEDDIESPCSRLATSTIQMLDEEYKSMPRGFLD